ncbi:2-oxoglutarate dehydrogenase complex dihydrolipoyllysine-residue succinyltransferase [Candidatus Williamhamiltonella defendens]|uniref:Dihydrolipoyllysine-residue succinyltransferase component of 2-oxoglutarate dehydrogenase complex n=1 Tax=Candidatus Hamiltonella defensa (Bemisia tabaci) TaxID=672795 RepID=A0A249DZ77_9ENTR|nr:2-oxoglutarate dehydrogenase complex dihydrolipoyllysine-residue succinyltransferase [Candidatus Hamiltonella defensa]ASX26575.1 dihydrolipoamide succinyltransferase [Candidatus Hamiltonella defensa (Bemisia tabaci)]CED78409.1 Dihydrolipoyllysine-residue succinyltransferase component of 2-oxoglutarate dehydrogenase complex [Candidatus Hamiltonella defensa (Bemisia tabaci)]
MNNTDILVPDLPESVVDATVGTWHKKPGERVQRDEVLVEIETDKVVLEVSASTSGILDSITEDKGATVVSRQKLGQMRLEDVFSESTSQKIQKNTSTSANEKKSSEKPASDTTNESQTIETLSPAIRRLIAEHELDARLIKATGPGGRMTREDVEQYLSAQNDSKKISSQPISQSEASDISKNTAFSAASEQMGIHRSEKRVPMTRLRKKISERLLQAKNNTAMLTTFNEVNMKPIMDLRKKYGEAFEKSHGVRLGLMSFYVKAVIEALKRYPEINASIDDTDIVYHHYFDISIAVSTPRGLVTPVLRDADTLSMADIEKQVKSLALKGRDGKLKVEELTGGNFTITNGGVFGSLMSTPIINPPQSAILGMHTIQERPMAVKGQVVILPMMYLALSYDHRLVDGRESVGYLVTIKHMLEDPVRLLLDL